MPVLQEVGLHTLYNNLSTPSEQLERPVTETTLGLLVSPYWLSAATKVEPRSVTPRLKYVALHFNFN
jgi:hypothetical protein